MDAKPISPWAPLRSRVFATLWTATVISNVGTWMHDVGAGWLMTSLAPSPLMVSLVQAATTLPIFLFALPAGAIADIVDRRRLLIVVQVIMALLALVLTLLVLTERITAVGLLVITFALGSCVAFVSPAWQAIVPSLVPRPHLPAAIALNSVGINISRAIGPAVAGALIASVGIFAPFGLNTLSSIGVIAALLWWRPVPAAPTQLPAERVWGAMVLGLRYTRHSVPLQAALIRAVAFFLFGSAFWALLPLVVRTQLQGGPTLYGLLLGSIGVGAVFWAVVMPKFARKLTPDRVVRIGTVAVAVTMLLNAFVHLPLVAIVAGLLFGMGWIAVLSTLSVSVQTAVPDWIRARAASVYLMVFFGSMSLGSVLWGAIASLSSLTVALTLAALGALAAIPLSARARLQRDSAIDATPAGQWPEPVMVIDKPGERSPVMTMIEYRIAAADVQQFLGETERLGQARRRMGAYAWGVMQDAADAERFVEYFLEASWLHHLRHHERVSNDDDALQRQIRKLHRGELPPVVTHLLGASAP